MIKASVIIPTKNGGNIFQKVIDKVLVQVLNSDFEIIVIDSGSKDQTVEYIKSKQQLYNNLKLFEILPQDFGHGKTRNYGASLAKGEFLVFITQDALPHSNQWLEYMLEPFRLSEDIVGVFGKHIPYEECDIFEKNNLKIHFQNFGEGIVLYKLDNKERYKREEGYRHLLCFYSDNSSAMRKAIWGKIPYDDVDFAEDQLWAKKIIELGYSKAYTSKSVVYHSHNYSFKEMFKRSYDDHRGLYKIYKYVPVKSFLLLPAHIFKHTMNDYRYLKTLSMSRNEKKRWLLFSILKNTNKYLGAYLGAKNFGQYLNSIFSREHIKRNQ